ncbi:glycosyltransferase family 1 protein [Celeribacter halophilus]|uniref:glycosyltransferase family 4 protein n=1 Tax=Celeribacter halophilus TaxID=576117 RepID=UPI0026E223E6|nr:glycosyltransferase family 1 protein [Celeribacter halophilus]MDO6724722.1 glycosyltransferase family 1 protein [Celeribacter halophilus]
MHSTLKVLLNGRFLTRPVTGVDRVATELAMALVAQLEKQQISVAVPAQPMWGEKRRPKVLLELNIAPTLRLRGYAWEQLALSVAAPKSWLLSLCNLGPVLRSRQVIMIHDAQVFSQPESYSNLFRRVYHFLLPLVARRARVVLTVSDYSRFELEKFGVVPPGKAVVIHNGVDHMGRILEDPNALARFGLSKGEYFLAIGSLAAHKNLSMLIGAAKRRENKSIPLIVAGGGNSEVFREAGLEGGEGIRFLGRVSDAELKALYSGARALMFPSKTEGFGLPPLEAMYCGCPVVATTGGAVPEICGDAAIYVSPSNSDDWINVMDDLVTNEDLCAALRRRGKVQAAKFTWANAAESLLEAVHAAQVYT